MKKSFLIVATFFIFLTGYSQTEKGKRFLGGQLSFSNSTISNTFADRKYDVKNLQFQFEPGFGYFIKDNLAIGTNLIFGVTSQNGDYVTPSNNNSINYGGSGFVRRYSKIRDNFYFILDGDLTYKLTQHKYRDSDDPGYQKIKTTQISLSIGPGLVYFITPNLGLQTSFGNIFYSTTRSKNILPLQSQNNTSQDSNALGIDLNMSTWNFGLSYYF